MRKKAFFNKRPSSTGRGGCLCAQWAQLTAKFAAPGVSPISQKPLRSWAEIKRREPGGRLQSSLGVGEEGLLLPLSSPSLLGRLLQPFPHSHSPPDPDALRLRLASSARQRDRPLGAHKSPRPGGGVAMWSLRVYTRKKRASRRLNVTPTPDPALPATAEGPAGPGRRIPVPWKPRRAGLRSATGGGQARRAGRRGLGPRAPRVPQADVQGVCPETCRPFSALKGNDRARGLPKIAEKAEQSGQGGSQSGPPRCVATELTAPVPSGSLLGNSILIFC